MWSLALREERRLRVFGNRVLRRTVGPKTDEVTGGWRTLHNEELNDVYYSTSIIRIINSRRMRWAGHIENLVESASEREENVHTRFEFENLEERDN
jgi:hypothetical protein